MNTQLRRTILIVEDSPEDREMYRRYLMNDRDYDYTIVEASLGEEGLNLWRQHQPDAVLLDYRLPDLDGLEFLAALQPQQPLPIVMVTGVGSEAIAVQSIKAGAQDYLVKGQITPEGLKLALDATIKTVQLQTQLQERIDRERVIAQIAQKVSRSLDLNEILHTTVTEVRQFLQTDRMVVFQVEPDGNGRVVAESVGAEWRSILADQLYDPCFAESYVDLQRQGRVTVKADIYDGSIDPCHVQLLAGLQVRANLVVPILHDDQFWGALIAHHCAAPRQWQSLEIDLLQQLSTQVSVAIRQAELYQQAQDELAERKRTEEVLRSSEERLRLGLQAARMGTWDWDIAENRIIWSANMESMFGLAPGEFDGSYGQFVSRLHPDDRDRVLEAINAAMTHGANYDIEFRVLYPDGTIRWALSQGKVFYDASGQPIRMSGVDLDITDRKQNEASLRDNEQLLRLAMSGAHAGSWDWEILTGKVVWSAENYVLYGLDPANGLPSYAAWENALHPDDQDRANAEVNRVLEQRLSEFQSEFRIIHPQLGVRWLLGLGRITFNQQGEPVRLSGINLDITAHKQAEASLRRSEEFNRRILENNQDCIKVLDLEGRILYMNDAGKKLLEIDDFAKYNRSLWMQFWQESDQDLAQVAFTNASAGTISKFEGQCPTVTGVPKWWEVIVVPLSDSQGKVEQILSVSHDITERIQSEFAIKESEERFRSTFEQAAIGVAHVGLDGRWLRVNQKLCDIVGYTESELLSMNFQSITHPDDLLTNLGYVQELIEGQSQNYTMEKRYIHKLGQVVWANLTVSLRRDALGAPLYLISAIEDINARIEAEFVLQAQTVELAKTTALVKLRNQELDRFSYVVSHDLKAPLRAISNLAGWIQEDLSGTVDLDIQGNLELMQSRVGRMETMIDSLLRYARLGYTEANMETFSIEDLLIEIVDSLDIPSSFTVSLPSSLSPITTNRVLLSQVLTNLISNACKHHNRLDGCIHVTAQAHDEVWELTVADDGPGIAPENHDRVFDIFQTLSSSDEGNTGIGLSIVKRIVETQGGEITLESQVGVGTTFRFTWRMSSTN